ncbi:hypothetical protein AKUA2103_04590 [Apilactobacillus kunkeei]|nr:hypothetical protein AKUA2103_04590 [Apilactobacillus kunkeei]CAI2650659.1 hypothetical protein AKUA1003_04580 [Apilactobacillus kunkeei]
MKICYWNCNGAFRNKYKEIIKEKADLYIVSEVEDISKLSFLNGFKQKIYRKIRGDQKGILFFTFSDDEILPLENNNYGIRYIIPVLFRGYKILGVWMKVGYIEDLYTYSAINIKMIENAIIIGDFNSNVIWDNKHGDRNHTRFDFMMKQIGLRSVYHYQESEKLGKETQSTFYMYRKNDKSYHIDYAYASECYDCKMKISDQKVIEYSDHMILTLTI